VGIGDFDLYVSSRLVVSVILCEYPENASRSHYKSRYLHPLTYSVRDAGISAGHLGNTSSSHSGDITELIVL